MYACARARLLIRCKIIKFEKSYYYIWYFARISVTLQPKRQKMCNLESFKIDLKALEEGTTVLNLTLDDNFFASVDGPEVSHGNVNAVLSIRRTDNYFEVQSDLKGEITIPCTRCLDDMQHAVETHNSINVKFGEQYEEDDDLVIVPEYEGILDIAWLLYEYVALSIPIQHVHETGKCNAAMIKMLNEHSATRSSDGNEEDAIDPRWKDLLKLKNNN